MRLNLGCGPDWRDAPEGWAHADRDDHGQRFVLDLARPETWPADLDGIEVAVMHHTLHMLAPDDARACLAALRTRTARGGLLRIGERDLWAGLRAWEAADSWLDDLVADDVEPTRDGKLLRWLTWHGTVRSLWSPDSLCDALRATGWTYAQPMYHQQGRPGPALALDNRPRESFYVEALV